jgi:excisionase family DNA binding protein
VSQEWLTTAQVLKELGISRPTLQRLIKSGGIKAYKMVGSKENHFRADDVAELKKPVLKEEG